MADNELRNNKLALLDQPQEQPSSPAGPVQIRVDPEVQEQAKRFFDCARKSASNGNHDYAVQMYLEGLLRDPDNLHAQQALLEQALRRQAAGGKKAGLMATLKLNFFAKTPKRSSSARSTAKASIVELSRAEEVWAKDPQNLSLADTVVQKMLAAGCLESAKWLATWLGEFNARSAKPNGRRFSMLADVFTQLGQEDKAIDACRAATSVCPEDAELHAKLQNMLATQAMHKGKYDDQKGFHQSLQNRESQERLQDQGSITRRANIADQQIAQAHKELKENPTVPGKVMPLIEALLNKDTAQAELEAIHVLREAYQQFGSYRFKQRIGEIHMRTNRRRARELRARLKADPNNQQLAREYKAMLKGHLQAELAHFQDSAKNYPTDMRLRFEVGRRLLQLGRYDEAIPVLQQGQRDPKNHLGALSLMGQCFIHKEWYPEAINVYTKALETPNVMSGDMGKELQYNLGRAYEGAGQVGQAEKAYSAVVQIDALYQDVWQRLKQLRSSIRRDRI